jgi:AraC-like DNA-binding protein
VLFVEPETPAGRALVARSGGAPERLPAETSAVFLRRLHRAWRTEADVEQVRLVCRQFVNELATTEPREPSDPRVLAAMAFIRERLSGPVTLAEVARSCHLSPGRFRHLFVAETGMPLRTYLLWRRFLTVWDLLMEGRSLSAAAQLAGFADSAHLSRTSRAMFGLPPSAVQMSGPLARRLRETAVRTS